MSLSKADIRRSLRAADAFLRGRPRFDVAPDRASAVHTSYLLGFQAGLRSAKRRTNTSTEQQP